MVAADAITMVEPGPATSSCAAMNTTPNTFAPVRDQNAADHYLRVQSVARLIAGLLSPFLPAVEVIVVDVYGKHHRAVIDPYVASQEVRPSDFQIDSVQKRVIQSLRGGKTLTKKQIAAVVKSDKIYLRGKGGVDEMATHGLVAKVDEKYELTDDGNALAAEGELTE